MIQGLPFYVSFIFMIVSALTAVFLLSASNWSVKVIIVILIFLTAEGVLGITGFYRDTEAFPPRFVFLAMPAFIFMLSFFFHWKGKEFINSLNPETLTYLHIVRIPVEIVLYLLFAYKYVPEIMTFEGNNFDILAGISAPFAAYFGYSKKSLNRSSLLIWNFICLGLLLNIVVTAILSAPTPFQKIPFDQPEFGIFYFPFVWLPGFIVPAVLFSHLVCIRKLLIN